MRRATTGGDGRIVIPAMPAGSVFIFCRGSATGSTVATIPEGGEVSVDIPCYTR